MRQLDIRTGYYATLCGKYRSMFWKVPRYDAIDKTIHAVGELYTIFPRNE